MAMQKEVVFVDGSKNELKRFPDDARRTSGGEIERLQKGLMAADGKPMKTVGAGVREIRVEEDSGSYRVVYVVGRDAVYVLAAFKKETPKTARRYLALARSRLKGIG